MSITSRFAAIRIGYWLGWASIMSVLVGLALGLSVTHRGLIAGATLAAAAGNTGAMVVPWRAWLASRRGRIVLDVWCAGLIAFVAVLVGGGGSSFALLLFLVVPFVAVVQQGWRRGLWLAVAAATCVVLTALLPLSAGVTAMRLALVAAAVTAALGVARALARETARAELARARAQEASHRVKNDLQMAADLLLLGRPEHGDATAFDETAERIRSIAAVHRLLTEDGDRVDGRVLLRRLAAESPARIEVEAEPVAFDAATAQQVGIVANELITNALQHGAGPIRVRLQVDDAGAGARSPAPPGLGLRLVGRMVEQGLHGRFRLRLAAPGGGTRAEVVFPRRSV